MSEKYGGAAFPFPADVEAIRQGFYPQTGMSLRDYFAGQALAGMTANASWISYSRGFKAGQGANDAAFSYNASAIEAYKLADAMLKAREDK